MYRLINLVNITEKKPAMVLAKITTRQMIKAIDNALKNDRLCMPFAISGNCRPIRKKTIEFNINTMADHKAPDLSLLLCEKTKWF